MDILTLEIEGMHRSGCAETIEALLRHTPGVQRAAASFESREVRVLYDPHSASEEQLTASIEQAGYRVVARNHD